MLPPMIQPGLLLILLLKATDVPPAVPPTPAVRHIVDRVVAVIDQQPLLLSELRFEARVALIDQGGIQAAHAPLTDEALAAALELTISQRLVFAEADRLGVFAVDDAETTQAVQTFARQFAHEQELRDFLQDQEASDDQLAAILRRGIRVKHFLDSKLKLSARTVSTSSMRDRYRTLVRSQLEELRARADVRITAPFAARRATDGDSTEPRP